MSDLTVDRVVEIIEARYARESEQSDEGRIDGYGAVIPYMILRDQGERVGSTLVKAMMDKAVRQGRLFKLQGKEMEWWHPMSGSSRAASYYFTREGLAERERVIEARRKNRLAEAEAEAAHEKRVASLSEKLGIKLTARGISGVVIDFDELQTMWLDSLEGVMSDE